MRLTLFVASVICAIGPMLAAAKDNPLALVTDSSRKSFVGELLQETDSDVVLRNIKDGTEFRASKVSLKKFEKAVSDETAIRTAGLPAVVAWHVAQNAVRTSPVGKVANVAQNVIYVTVGAEKGASVGQKLDVYRKANEIRDPDTNKVIAVERPKIGVIEVTEANKEFSKGKLIGDLEVTLQNGDEVEVQRQKFQVAVLPFRTEKGDVYGAAAELVEDLTTQLVRQEITVLERSALDKVVLELALQTTVLFEPENVQKLGQLSGASVIVTGKIVTKGKTGTAYARLIDVRTGRILYAASCTISLANANILVGADSSKPAANTNGSRITPKAAFRSNVIELTEKAPNSWILKEAKVGLPIWPDKPYVWLTLPKEIVGGSAIWRDTGHEGWLQPGVVTALKDCTAYAIIRWKYLGKEEMGEITFAQFAKDGWEEVEGEAKCSFPGGEDWRWTALRKEVKAGDVVLQLDRVNFGRRAVQFIFK